MFFPRFTTPFLFCFSLLMPPRLQVTFCLPRFLVESWLWITVSLSLSLRWLYRGVAPLLSPSRSIKEKMRQRGTLSVCHQKRTIPTYLPANYSMLLNCPAVLVLVWLCVQEEKERARVPYKSKTGRGWKKKRSVISRKAIAKSLREGKHTSHLWKNQIQAHTLHLSISLTHRNNLWLITKILYFQ